jgi:hypothetical protein
MAVFALASGPIRQRDALPKKKQGKREGNGEKGGHEGRQACKKGDVGEGAEGGIGYVSRRKKEAEREDGRSMEKGRKQL